jgi:hypothetical protein
VPRRRNLIAAGHAPFARTRLCPLDVCLLPQRGVVPSPLRCGPHSRLCLRVSFSNRLRGHQAWARAAGDRPGVVSGHGDHRPHLSFHHRIASPRSRRTMCARSGLAGD